MTQNANRTIALSTQINRCLFDGDLERTLYLIGELMRTGGLSVPARALPRYRFAKAARRYAR